MKKTLKICKQNFDKTSMKTSKNFDKKAWKFFGIAWRIKTWGNLHKVIHKKFLGTQESS